MNIGIEILETPGGRSALQALGTAAVDGWHEMGLATFGGDPKNMAFYVNHFLKAIRRDFPLVILDHALQNLDQHAYTKRVNGERIDLYNLQPKDCAGIYYNATVCYLLPAHCTLLVRFCAKISNLPARREDVSGCECLVPGEGKSVV